MNEEPPISLINLLVFSARAEKCCSDCAKNERLRTRAAIKMHHFFFSEVFLNLGAYKTSPKKLPWGEKTKILPDENSPQPRYTTRFFCKNKWGVFSDDFGLRSSVIQKPF